MAAKKDTVDIYVAQLKLTPANASAEAISGFPDWLLKQGHAFYRSDLASETMHQRSIHSGVNDPLWCFGTRKRVQGRIPLGLFRSPREPSNTNASPLDI